MGYSEGMPRMIGSFGRSGIIGRAVFGLLLGGHGTHGQASFLLPDILGKPDGNSLCFTMLAAGRIAVVAWAYLRE
jgi:hypothetical protein